MARHQIGVEVLQAIQGDDLIQAAVVQHATTTPVVLAGTDPATVPLKVLGAEGQTNAIFEVSDFDEGVGISVSKFGRLNVVVDPASSAPAFTVTPNGASGARFDVGMAGQVEIATANPSDGIDPLTIFAPGGSFTGDTKVARVTNSGAIITAANSAPEDADLANGEMATWFDQTNGAAKLMIKAKTADGTVVVGSVSLAP